MSSLQALLDAQGQRGSSSGRGGGSGGSRSRNNWSSVGGRSSRPGYDHDDGGGRGSVNPRNSWQSSARDKTNNDYDGNRERSNRSFRNREDTGSSGRWGNLSSGNNNHNDARSKEPTYEERRANIEQRAIKESRQWGANTNSYADRSNEEDIESLLSWVGPLIDGKKCTYYQDRDKRYPFYTDERGYTLLQELMETNMALLKLNQKRLEEEAAAVAADQGVEYNAKDVIIRIGQGLYAHKPTLRTKGVTWSTEEYSHPGLQRMYLRMKSIQRFTEIWCLLERSAAIGVFDEFFERNKEAGTTVLRIAAVGGGPGYELLATKLFFAERAPGIELELICMDLCPAWRPYVEQLGFRFVGEYDINEEGNDPLRAAGLERGLPIHFCIVSCVMIYCTNNNTMNMFRKLVHEGGVKAILVSERGERTSACTMMEDLGVKVIRLIDQSNGMDERQAIWCSQEFSDEQLRTCSPDFEAHQDESVFPNVPYCEHKERRSGGSGRTRHYPRR